MNSISISSTPPLSVPPTQNTAPVIKFRCLFTHDVRRKAKRWQDGILRFHTFNRRIMVYDTQMNLIGDLHWRESDRIHDGDELELERGVLVQVEQELESTVTDLTPLLEKKKQAPAAAAAAHSSPTRVASPQTRQSGISTPYPSSSHLKSLNEVLGIRKTSSFARSPVVRSPYEERQQQIQADEVNDGPVERPSKKRRTSPKYGQEESRVTKDERSTRQNDDPADDTQNNDIDTGRTVPARTSSSAKPLSKPYQRPSMSSTNPSFQLASTLKAEDLRSPPKGRRKQDNRLPSNQKSVTDMFQNKPVTTLRIADERPRKKLMCLEMLSGPDPEQPPKRASHSTAVQRIPTSESAISSSQKTKSLLEFFKPKTAMKSQLRPNEQGKEQEQELETDAGAGLIDDSTPTVDNESKPSPPGTRLPIQRSFSTTDVLLDQSLNIPIDSKESEFIPDSQAHPNPPRPKPQFPNKTGLQKSLSDTSALRAIQKPNNRTFQTKLFTTARGVARSNAPRKEDETDVEEEAKEMGPWTTEALDLFDWWPPDRPKPSAVGVS